MSHAQTQRWLICDCNKVRPIFNPYNNPTFNSTSESGHENSEILCTSVKEYWKVPYLLVSVYIWNLHTKKSPKFYGTAWIRW